MYTIKQLYRIFIYFVIYFENVEHKQELDEKKSPNASLPSIDDRLEELKVELEELRKSNGNGDKLISEILSDGDPKDIEYQKLAEKVKEYQEELKKLDSEAGIIKKLEKLLDEINLEIRKLSPREIKKLQEVSNKVFLEIPSERRLQYITKNHIDYEKVANGEEKNIEFTFTFDGKFNDDLYKNTSAGQVLPKEVREVKLGDIVYSRKSLKGEFFNESSGRLLIHEGTKIETKIGDITDLETKLSKDIEEYISKNKENEKYRDIITEAFSRGIDPDFAIKMYSDEVKNLQKDSLERKVLLEDMFTDFDRIKNYVDIGDGKKYSDEFIVSLIKEINPNKLKEKAKKFGINEDKLSKLESLEVTIGIKGLLNFISKAEGTHGNYNAIYGSGLQNKVKFTQMTLKEVLEHQGNHARKTGSSAIGKYQIMQYTLRDLIKNNNLDMNQKFSPELQDKLAIKLLERRGLKKFQDGKISLDKFIGNLSQEWASLPKDNGGRSFYHGDKMGNRALVSYNDIYSTLSSIRSIS